MCLFSLERGEEDREVGERRREEVPPLTCWTCLSSHPLMSGPSSRVANLIIPSHALSSPAHCPLAAELPVFLGFGSNSGPLAAHPFPGPVEPCPQTPGGPARTPILHRETSPYPPASYSSDPAFSPFPFPAGAEELGRPSGLQGQWAEHWGDSLPHSFIPFHLSLAPPRGREGWEVTGMCIMELSMEEVP